MAPPSDFLDYPQACEGPETGYAFTPRSNPVLSGLPLSLGASIVANVSPLQQFFWNNTGFGALNDIPDLDQIPARYHPVVTPLGETGPMLEFGPELLKPKYMYTGSSSRFYTISDYHSLYKSGRATPLQVIEALLPLTRKDRSRYSDAWVDTTEQHHLALEAARASTARYAAGEPLGVLDGVPFGVKDDTESRGYVSYFGLSREPDLPIFQKAEKSVWPVKKLQEAGAIVLGKNCMHQLGSDTDDDDDEDTSGCNPSQGTPTNHMNPFYYPGGSSSGGSSAIGAGFIPFAVGSDAGGSSRIPATYNGVYGLKPSHHRTMKMWMTTLVTTPIAASVADLTIAYRVMSQPDPDCPTQGRFALSRPPEPSAKRVMGIYRDWWKAADPRVVQVCDRAIEYFEKKLGYDIVDITIPYLAEGSIAHSLLCLTEMASLAKSGAGGDSDWLSYFNPACKLLMAVGTRTPAAEFIKSCAMRELLMRHLAYLFQKYPGLLIMTPVSPIIGWERMDGDENAGMSDSNTTIRNMIYVFLANITGTPALSAPVGYVDPEKGEGKLPIGLMATGEWGSEEQLLSWAAEAEEYLHETYEGGRIRPRTWLDVMDFVTGRDKGTY